MLGHPRRPGESTTGLVLLELLINHLSIIGKRGVVLGKLPEVSIFLHVDSADSFLFFYPALIRETNLGEEVVQVVTKASQISFRSEFKVARDYRVQRPVQGFVESLDPILDTTLV